MKLTKKLQADLIQVYETWWKSYLNGDVKTYDSFLADDFHFVGSTNGEEYLNKRDTTAFFEATADQLAGKAELRNTKRTIEELEPGLILITDVADAYVASEPEWVYYSRFRFTSLLRYTKNGWRFIYQHFSAPDTKAQEGETLGTEQITRENQELRDAIKRRTVELEHKTRELEIEAALERVRAEAMGMNKPDDILAICKVMFKELQLLGFSQLRNTLINFWDDDSNTLIDYDYSDDTGAHKSRLSYSSHPVFEQFQKKIKHSKDAFAELVITNEQLESWKQRRRDSGEYEDPRLNNIAALYYYFYSIEVGAIGISTFSPITEEQLNVLKRFRNVFDFAYRRYADVAQAEAQAREATIEAALERTRTQSMIMQHSTELDEALRVFHEQVLLLGIHSSFSFLWLPDEANNRHIFWAAWQENNLFKSKAIDYPLNRNEPATAQCLVDWKSNEPVYSYQVPPAAVDDYFAAWKELLGGVEKLKPEYFPDGLFYVEAFMKYGCFGVMVTTDLSEEEKKILGRFAIEFERTYTRFLDLQKAEAQAREAEIELALERVRARTMAMQRSEELVEVATVLFQQVKGLGVPQWNCGFNIWNIGDKEFTYYPGSPDGIISPSPCKIPLTEHPVFKRFDESRRRGEELLVYEKEGEEQADHYRYMLSLPGVGDLLQSMLDAGFELPKFQIDHLANFAYGNLIFITYEHFPKMHDVFKRFAKVFEQTYTRFLDLQKAEAQTREAQINLAVERVRARALAMYKSEEILELVFKLKQEIMDLDIPNVAAATIHLKEKDGNYTMWDLTAMEYSEGKIHQPMIVYYRLEELDPNLFIKRMWDNTASYFLVIQDKEDLKRTIQFLRDHDRKKEADETEVYLKNAGINYGYHPTIPLHNGRMCIDLLEPPSGEIEQILTKMGAAFDLAYKRFEDLKNSEAQLKEAQIEAALERVRSKSMAMHKSEELKEVIKLVYEQLRYLKINLDHAGFVVDYTPKGDWHFWIADEQDIPSKISHPYFESVWANQYNEAKGKGEELFATHLTFEEKNKFYNDLLSCVPGIPDTSKDFYLNCPGLAVTTVLLENVGLYIENFSGTPYTDEENNILMRFGKVFQQTYTRFLDLQKAEAQARESEIELALERVRARTMAMQKSDELREVIQVIHNQLVLLGFDISNSGIMLDYKQEDDFYIWMADSYEEFPVKVHIPYIDHPQFNSYKEAKEKSLNFYSKTLTFEEKNKWFQHVFKNINGVTEETKEAVYRSPGMATSSVLLKNTAIYLLNYAGTPYSNAQNETLIRFGKVFEQTYTRFNDLQQAEAQAREAKIEAALEKARARTMGMQSSDELPEVANVLFLEIQALGIPAWSCGYNILTDDKTSAICCMSSEGTLQTPFKLRLYGEASFAEMGEFIRSEKTMLVQELGDKALEEHYAYMKSFPDLKPTFDQIDELGLSLPTYQINHLCKFTQGFLLFITYEKVPDSHDIFKRFTKVFDQTYTRFLDLQKAEAQARESQIEAALERVRSRTMAMQRSDELPETSYILFQQMKELGEPAEQLSIGVVHEENNVIEISATLHGGILNKIYWHSIDEPFVMNKVYRAWKAHQKTLIVELKGDQLNAYNKYRNQLTNSEMFPTDFDDEHRRIVYAAFFSKGMLAFAANEPRPLQSLELLERFASVFDLTYTRFLDLQKAEAQAREAKIEAALEKVRARTMGMQKSDELADVAKVLFTELNSLVHNLWTCGFVLCEKERKEDEWWLSMDDGFTRGFFLPNVDDYAHSTLYEGWLKGEDFRAVQLQGNELQAHYDWLMKVPVAKSIFEEMDAAGLARPDWQKLHAAYFSKGYLVIITREPSSEESIFKRFAQVFDLTYTRFLDLQKAEAQAREAQIEAALERVRAKVMAMNNSKDLDDTSLIFGEQLRKLGIDWQFSYFWLIDESKNENTFWITWPDYKTSITVYTLAEAEEYFNECLISWRGGVKIHDSHISTEEVKGWLDTFQRITDDAGGVAKEIMLPKTFTHGVYYYDAMMKYGSFGICINKPATNEEKNIQSRFAVEFERAYTRFLDLQRAETQASEAIKRASVDRVRAEIASMRTTSDLERIQPLIWNELKTLGIPFIRCGVFIMEEEKQEVNTLLSTPDGKAIAAFRQSYNAPGEISAIVDSWHKKKMYKQHWDEEQFLEFAKNLVQQGAINTGEKYLTENRPTDLYLHFFPFLQGMLYVGNTLPLEDDELQLVQNLADAFSTAYARYEDFNKLELAKKQVDNTLNELQATQKQLIQSEKMASLGELTAGIAHEIQNPLNFVNNFSEVSNELISEMVDEVEKGNTAEVKTIALNIQQNLEKIIHHGKRADTIVKGMLQHSRTSNGQKEPTNINALADEYLRLAYHGLRAKDKSFNAMLNTAFDESIGNLNIIPQDIGRVILNLITNAFYAVDEKKKHCQYVHIEDYEPTVSLSTKKINNNVEIKIADNGNGVPRKILDKIFQPFFTTKPTGQGTGLGLSLSYDIVKAHGGELIVETKEGEGSEFIIQLQTN